VWAAAGEAGGAAAGEAGGAAAGEADGAAAGVGDGNAFHVQQAKRQEAASVGGLFHVSL
jgi:hypothetical protein